MKKKTISVLVVLAVLMCLFIPSFTASAADDPPVLTGNSVYRESATVATVRFLSDTAGTAHYQITDSVTPPGDVVTGGTDGGAVTANATKVMSLSGLTAGAQYVHIVVEDGDGAVSDPLTVAMPYDVCYYEDFEAYPLNMQANNPLFSLAYVTASDSSAQKVVDGDSSRALTLVGGSGHYSCVKLDLPDDLTGTLVLEADIKPTAGGNPAYLRLHDNTDMVTVRPINDSEKKWYVQKQLTTSESLKNNYPLDNSFEYDTWYNVKMVYSFSTDTFDVYLDDVKVNDTPYTGFSGSSVSHTFQLLAGNTAGASSLFDNVKIYSTPAVPAITGLAASPATRSSAGGDVTITVSGSDLTDGITVTAFDGDTATAITATTAGSAAEQTVTLTFPGNSGSADKVYTIKASLDDGTNWDSETCTVTVQKPVTSNPPPGPTIYTVKFDLNGGSGSVANQSVTSGGKATKPTDPNRDSFTFTGWYTDKDCTEKYDFAAKVTKNLTLYAGWKEIEEPEPWGNPFTDVSPNDWFYGDVEYVYVNGLFYGTSETAFSPQTSMSRAMLVTVLYRMAGEPSVDGLDNPFTDVPDSEWYTDAVIWAHADGIVEGYGSGLFGTNNEITREDLCVMLLRYAKFMGIELPQTLPAQDFTDADRVADYAKEAVMALYRAGVIEGKGGGIFDPKGTATRAEVAAMLHRFLTA